MAQGQGQVEYLEAAGGSWGGSWGGSRQPGGVNIYHMVHVVPTGSWSAEGWVT